MLLVSFRVFQDLVFRELFPRHRSTGGIADQSSEIADKKNDDMAKLLKVPHLSHQDRVADMNIGGCRIKPRFHAQRLSGFVRPLEFLDEFLFANDLNCTSPDMLELLFHGNFSEIVHTVIRAIRGSK